MTKCLAYISAAVLYLLPQMAQAQTEASDIYTAEYDFAINARGHEMAGLWIAERKDNGLLVGTIVNEIGLKLLDFTYNGRKTKISNVFPPLNKWYIRKVIRKDLHFLIEHPAANGVYEKGKRSISHNDAGETTLVDKRYNITYKLARHNEQE